MQREGGEAPRVHLGHEVQEGERIGSAGDGEDGGAAVREHAVSADGGEECVLKCSHGVCPEIVAARRGGVKRRRRLRYCGAWPVPGGGSGVVQFDG